MSTDAERRNKATNAALKALDGGMPPWDQHHLAITVADAVLEALDAPAVPDDITYLWVCSCKIGNWASRHGTISAWDQLIDQVSRHLKQPGNQGHSVSIGRLIGDAKVPRIQIEYELSEPGHVPA